MTHAHAKVRSVVVLVPALAVILAIPAIARADDPQREIQFARGLLGREWFDLAEKVSLEVENDAGTPVEMKAEAAFLRADILKQKAGRTGDTADFDAYEKLLAEIQAKYPNAQRAKFAVVDQLLAAVNKAQTLAKNAAQAADPEEAKQQTAEARSLFQQAFTSFQAAIANLTKQVEADEENQDLEYKRDLLEYLEASSYLAYGRTFEVGDTDRHGAFDNAHKKLETFLETRTGWFNLWSFAYRDKGVALAELGKFEEAKILFDELTAIEPWFMPQDPQARKELMEFVNAIALESHFQHARTCNLSKAYSEAVDSIDVMFKRKELGADKHHFGKLAILEKGKALAALGRSREGAAAVYQMVTDGKDSPNKIPGFDFDVYGLTACKALSEMVELSGEVFPAPMQFHAALGFFFRGLSEQGIWGYKGVLVTAAGEADRPYAIRALRELGDLYYHVDRPIESAIAYRQYYKSFPDDEQAGEMMKRARAAINKAVELFGEKDSGPLTALKRKIENDLQSSGEGFVGEQLKFNNAATAQKNGQYDRAAKEYLSINPEVEDKEGNKKPVPFYVNAMSNAGYCYLRLYQQDRERNAKYADTAVETLRKAEKAAIDRKSDADRAIVLYFMAQVLNDAGQKKHKEALEALKPFDGPLASVKKYVPRARYEQIVAAVALGDLTEAERAFKAMDTGEFNNDDSFRVGAFDIGQAFAQAAEKLPPTELTKAGAYRAKAAGYVHKWFSLALASEKAQRELTVDSMEWAGTVCFNGRDFGKALEVFQALLEKHPKAGAKPEQFRTYARVDLNLGWCLLNSGKEKEADEILTELSEMAIISEKEVDGITDIWRGKVLEQSFNDVTIELDAPKDKAGQKEKIAKRSRDKAVTRFNREYRLLAALAQARWKMFVDMGGGEVGGEISADAKRFVSVKGGLKDAIQQLYLRLRSMDDDAYRDLVESYGLTPASFSLKKLEVFYKLVQIKFFQEKWEDVKADINIQLQQGLLDDAVHLKNGRNVPGKIKTMDASSVTIVTRTGEQTIKAADYSRIDDHREVRDKIMKLRDLAKGK